MSSNKQVVSEDLYPEDLTKLVQKMLGNDEDLYNIHLGRHQYLVIEVITNEN